MNPVFFHKTLSSVAVIGLFLTICSYIGNVNAYQPPLKDHLLLSDSPLTKLQLYLDSNYASIDQYYRVVSDKETLNNKQDDDIRRMSQIPDSIDKLLNPGFCDTWSKKPSPGQDQKIKTLKNVYEAIVRMQEEDKKLNEDYKVSLKLNQSLDSQASKLIKKYNEVSKTLAGLAPRKPGAGVLTIHKNNYRFFIASKTEHTVQVYTTKSGPASIESLKKDMSKNSDLLMITNGGMFSPGYTPQGLLVRDSKKYHDLDTLSPEKSNLNFYLLPNGVFYVDQSGNFKIDETGDYRKMYPAQTNKLPLYATQSGPMILRKGAINKNFRAGSPNVNIRSGAGIIDSGKVVFVISDNPVNFYDFTLVFKEVFRCNNALYLDGAISQMYINEKLLPNKNAPINGEFGPLLSVTQKKKP